MENLIFNTEEELQKYETLTNNGSLSIIPEKVYGEVLSPKMRLELFEKRTLPLKNPQGYLSLDKDDKLLFQKYNNNNQPISFEKSVELRDIEYKSNKKETLMENYTILDEITFREKINEDNWNKIQNGETIELNINGKFYELKVDLNNPTGISLIENINFKNKDVFDELSFNDPYFFDMFINYEILSSKEVLDYSEYIKFKTEAEKEGYEIDFKEYQINSIKKEVSLQEIPNLFDNLKYYAVAYFTKNEKYKLIDQLEIDEHLIDLEESDYIILKEGIVDKNKYLEININDLKEVLDHKSISHKKKEDVNSEKLIELLPSLPIYEENLKKLIDGETIEITIVSGTFQLNIDLEKDNNISILKKIEVGENFDIKELTFSEPELFNILNSFEVSSFSKEFNYDDLLQIQNSAERAGYIIEFDLNAEISSIQKIISIEELNDILKKDNEYEEEIEYLIDNEQSYEKYEEFEHLYKETRNDEPKQILINEENPKTMEENKVDHPANEYYEKFRSNPTSSFINHHDIFSIMMSKLPQKDKLDLINEMTKNETPLENLKGLNKGNVIDTIVKPIIANNSPEDIMAFKGKVNAMKDAAETNFQDFKKTEKGEIKFVESKVSAEEYSKFLMENKDSIINAEKNASSVSTSLLLLAYLENRTTFLAQDKTKENVDFADILVKSGVSPERAAEFTKVGIFNHTPVTNELKKLTAREINSNPDNVNMFKNLTKTHPTKNVAKDVDVNLENDNKNQVKR